MATNGTIFHYWSFNEQVAPTGSLEKIQRVLPTQGSVLNTSAGFAVGDWSVATSFGVKSVWTYNNTAFTGAVTWDLTALPAPEAVAVATGSPIITLAQVKGILIYSTAGDGIPLYFGNPGTNGWGSWIDTLAARALIIGGIPWATYNLGAQAVAPWTVDATHKVIKLDAGANTFAVSMAILGA
jgi:hypothetical protein